MERVKVEGGELEYEVRGSGEPLVLIHGSICGETWGSMMAEPALSGFRQIAYHRRGFLGSAKHTGPFSIKQQAQDALAVIKQVAGGTAHVAGHSYGGATALQLAIDEPGAVHTLTLMEPLPPEPVPLFDAFFGRFGPVNEMYAAGDKAGATGAFLDIALDSGWRPKVAPHLPAGWFDRAVADIDGFFQVELPAVPEWLEGGVAAGSVRQPTLSVVGGDSERYFGEVHELLLRVVPGAIGAVIPGVTHGLQFMDPNAVAQAIARFCAKHPMPAAARV
jgi:3-oxoadipate enol-lactonase